MNKQCCGTCALWDRDAAKDSAGRLRGHWTAQCLWKSTEVYPASVRDYETKSVRPHANRTVRDDGKDCPCWKPRT